MAPKHLLTIYMLRTRIKKTEEEHEFSLWGLEAAGITEATPELQVPALGLLNGFVSPLWD